ncbi:hypothetical protein [Streptomyces chattanoogensis]|nr:hypothetical protein [Streptomyces chattanoogensis]AJT63820.1 hypothetical protein T261_2135 [Streptomyces lydicus]
MRTALLAFLYAFVVTPIGLLRRLVRDPLSRRWDPRAHTYWTPSAARTR